MRTLNFQQCVAKKYAAERGNNTKQKEAMTQAERGNDTKQTLAGFHENMSKKQMAIVNQI